MKYRSVANVLIERDEIRYPGEKKDIQQAGSSLIAAPLETLQIERHPSVDPECGVETNHRHRHLRMTMACLESTLWRIPSILSIKYGVCGSR